MFVTARSRRMLATSVALLLAVSATAAGPAETARAAESTYYADLASDNVIPPPEGDVASGSGFLDIDPAAGTVCWDIVASTSSEAPTIELRHGPAGENGPVVLDLGTTNADGQAMGCLSAQSEATLAAIVATPDAYHLQVGTETTPTGVLRAQLQLYVPTSELLVITRLCPKAIQTLAQFTDAPEGTCGSATRPGDPLAIPAGYTVGGWAGTWSFDYVVTTMGTATASLSEADPNHWGTCDATTKTCTFGALSYAWQVQATTGRSVRAATVPAGHRVAAVRVSRLGGGAVASTYSATTRTSTFDLTDVDDNVWVEFVYFVSDTTAPTVTTPRTSLRTGTVSSGGSIPVTVSWSGSDAGAGVARYQVQRRVNAGSWTTLATDVRTTSLSTVGGSGSTYEYRVRGIDRVGNVSSWVAGAPRTLSAVQNSSTAIRYTGTWTTLSSTSAYGGTVRRSSSSAARATLTRTARALELVARTVPGGGHVKVYVDGAYKATVDLDGPSTWRVVAWRGSWSSLGTHTVELRPVGDGSIYLDAWVSLR